MKALLPLLFLFSTPAMAQLIVEDHIKFLALGDSYTIGESVTADQRWPVQLIDSLSKRGLEYTETRIIAVTGWRTDNLKEAISKAKLKGEYTLVSLLIGVNNYYQGKSVESYIPEFEELLQTAVTLAGGIKSRVFVLSIPDYGYTPFGKNNQLTITQGIDAFNAANESITKKWGVKYYNITDISRRGLSEIDLVAFDGLHPSGKMYSEWVKRILSDVTIKLEEEPSTEEEEEEDDDDEGNNGDNNDVTGVEDERYGLKVYPNPFHNYVTVESLLSSQYTLQLIAPNGSVALSISNDKIGPSRQIDTRSLSSGNYTLTLEAFGKILKSQKVLKI
jgi:lysophospholipase L1-like esterase